MTPPNPGAARPDSGSPAGKTRGHFHPGVSAPPRERNASPSPCRSRTQTGRRDDRPLSLGARCFRLLGRIPAFRSPVRRGLLRPGFSGSWRPALAHRGGKVVPRRPEIGWFTEPHASAAGALPIQLARVPPRPIAVQAQPAPDVRTHGSYCPLALMARQEGSCRTWCRPSGRCPFTTTGSRRTRRSDQRTEPGWLVSIRDRLTIYEMPPGARHRPAGSASPRDVIRRFAAGEPAHSASRSCGTPRSSRTSPTSASPGAASATPTSTTPTRSASTTAAHHQHRGVTGVQAAGRQGRRTGRRARQGARQAGPTGRGELPHGRRARRPRRRLTGSPDVRPRLWSGPHSSSSLADRSLAQIEIGQ
jgi:hypothetical protein